MGTTLRTSNWSRRSCPICERSDLLVAIGKRTIAFRQRTETFEWRQVDGLCSGCGLIQSLDSPEPGFLNDYYADAHITRTSAADALITPGFDVEARLSPIRRFHSGGRLLEIGAGDGAFCDALRKEGIDAVGVDPLNADESDLVVRGYASKRSLGEESASTVVAYDVMEHAADPRDWLETAVSLLDPGGILILEVPDTHQWPVEAWHHEHLTQFTRESLQLLCERIGLETVSCGVEPPSRPHGIIYVGRIGTVGAAQKAAAQPPADEAITAARELYARAERIRSHQQQAARHTAALIIRATPSDPSQTCEVVVWGANEIASAIGAALHDANRNLTVRIVDNADSKIGVPHPGFRTAVERPEFQPKPDSLFIFVLCSRVWNEQIAEQITGMGLVSPVIIDGTNWPAE